MGKEQTKCSYTRWAWFSLHLRDECICARDVTSPTVNYQQDNFILVSFKTIAVNGISSQPLSGGIHNGFCIPVRDSGHNPEDGWRHVTQESREISIRLRGVTGKKTL
jgi:hypothetical protein